MATFCLEKFYHFHIKSYIARKTRKERVESIEVPLNQTAMSIVAKYWESQKNTDKLLPFISPQKYNDCINEAKRNMEKDIALNNSDVLLTSNQVLERLSISRTTLWHWVKKRYIIPIEIGGKQRYKLSDVNAILKGDNEVFKEA